MISVSNKWKTAQNKILLPEMFVEITYDVTEPGLQESATASGNYPEVFSNTAQITSVEKEVVEQYATLDYGAWGLDGSFALSNGSPVNQGYVDTNYSTANAEMAVTPYPTITVDFQEKHDVLIPGLVITWSETFVGWATDFRITTYNNGRVVGQKVVHGNKAVVTEVWFDLVEYTRITIEVLKWSHPYQRVRCTDINLGLRVVYTKDDLLGYEHKQSADLLSATLPKNEIVFRLRNDDNRWNPNNPTGSVRYLLEQQQVSVRYGMDIDGVTEWVKGGTFWVSEWNTPSNGIEATFTAKDVTSFMTGIYTGIRSGSLYDVALAALTQADLPQLDDGSERYVLDTVLQEIETDFSNDTQEYTIGEVLQMVAHAGGCVFYQDRAGVAHIEQWARKYSGYVIDPMISYTHPEYTINKPLKAVSVQYGEDLRAVLEVASKGETQTVNNPLIITESDALRICERTSEILTHRNVITGDFRADLVLDALDSVIVTSKYSSNVIGITDIAYSTTGGGFKGTYTGRVISVELVPTSMYSGEFYVGEV